MKIEALALRGLLRFTSDITVDVRRLPPGLIAITGRNGEGKTTLLESAPACLWRAFPSRRDRALVDYATGRDAYLDVTFSIDGQGLYRARVALDGVTRQSEAVVEQIDPNGQRYVLTDGKVTDFDRWIAAHLPSPDLVLASVFAAQNRAGSFVTQDRKARKQLFATLLGLEHYEAMAQTARGAVALIDEHRLKARTTASLLARETAPEILTALQEEHDAVTQAAARVLEERARAAEERAAAAEARRALQAHVTEAHAQAARRDALLATLATAREGIARLTTQRAQVPEECAAKRRGLSAATQAKLADLDRRLTNNRGILAEADAIRAAQAELAAHAAAWSAAADALTAAHASREQAWRDRQTRQQYLHEAQREVDRLTRAAHQAALLDTVPCRGAGAYAACQFLQAARAAAVEAETLTMAHAACTAAQTALDDADRAVTNIDARLEALAAERGPHQQAMASLQSLAAKGERLSAAQARVTELETQRVQVTAEAAEADAALVAECDARLETLAGALADAAEAVVHLEEELAVVEAAQASAAAVLAQAADLERTETAARLREERAIADHARLEAQVDAVGQRRQRYEARVAEHARVSAWQTALDDEWQVWARLAKAFSRDGLPVLEIDAAGPTVSAYCNDLLQACFGGRFSVELVTQEVKTSGKGTKETFDIRVYDNARGGAPRDLADLSGGEQIICDEAVKNAIAIFANTRSPFPIQTCWRDETTGALDGENARRYIEMLRRVQAIAGFHHVFVVSHNPEAAAMADAQLVVADGQVEVRLPPYATAA